MPHTAINIQKIVIEMGGILTYQEGRNGDSEISLLANLVASTDAVFLF